MDFNLRDWLLILGPVFIAGVLLHGYWRMRRNENELKMALDKSFMNARGDVDDLSMLRAELPNGGARVVSPREQGTLDLQPGARVSAAPVADEPAVSAGDAEARPARAGPEAPKPEKFVVLYVLANELFEGQALLEAFLSMDMTFGELDIFHRHDETGEPEFSVANAVEPGTFDPATMHEMTTRGVTLFMRAHERPDPVATYEHMVDFASRLAGELGGQICDGARSALTAQTIENERQTLREFQFRHSA